LKGSDFQSFEDVQSNLTVVWEGHTANCF